MNEELDDLMRSSTKDEDDDSREVDNDEEPAVWTLEKFSQVFAKAQALQDDIMEFDMSMEQALRVT